MREIIDAKSEAEGLQFSRLPQFSPEWRQRLNGSWDFLGLNHYSTELVRPEDRTDSGWSADSNTRTYQPAEWPGAASSWLKVVPWGFRKLLVWINRTYGNPPLYVTENGFSDGQRDSTEDAGRVNYYVSYINEMLKAVLLDGCNVKAYTGWSLMDNFEWGAGYS